MEGRPTAPQAHSKMEGSHMRPNRRLHLGNIAVALLLPTVLLAGGCASAALPAKLESQQQAAVAGVHFAATVGVEEHVYPIYSQRLRQRLAASGMFDRVEALADLPEPDLIARVEREVYGTAFIPVLVIVSLGIIPQSVEEEHGFEFSLRSRAGSAEPVPILASYSGTSTLGWWALAKNLSPRYGWGRPAASERYLWFLRAKLAEHREEIERLLPSKVMAGPFLTAPANPPAPPARSSPVRP